MMGQHPLWHICGLSLFIFLAVCNSRSRTSGILFITLWNLPGVILHEFAHLLMGIIFCAGPANISLIPRRTGNSWRLGCTGFSRINAVNAVPVALAPLGLALIAWLLARNWFYWFRPSLGSTLALYVSLFILLYNSLPSRRDLKVACNLKSVMLYAILVAAVFWFLSGSPMRHALPEGFLPVSSMRNGAGGINLIPKFN
jgi:hypothetical protein